MSIVINFRSKESAIHIEKQQSINIDTIDKSSNRTGNNSNNSIVNKKATVSTVQIN